MTAYSGTCSGQRTEQSDSLSRFVLTEVDKVQFFTSGDDLGIYFYRSDGRRNVLLIGRDGSVVAGWRESLT